MPGRGADLAPILARQELEGRGAKVSDWLWVEVPVTFPGMMGLLPRNLAYGKVFTQVWADPDLVRQAVALLAWGH